jgi:glyoxylase-like metal-dependent hydrolase (beta-lactamase superfamily II)
VFVIPDGRVSLVPNIGVVVGERAALVVDTGLGPRSGQLAYAMARELADDRPLFVTLTHFHPEHGFGASAFENATLVYNREQRDEFRQKGAGYLEQFRGLDERAARELENVKFVEPQIVYDGGCELELGGTVAQLRARGPAHSRGDQTIYLPDDRILFAGDLVEDGFFPIFPFFPPHDTDVDGDRWLEVLAELRGLDPAVVVPGHGALGGVELIDAYRDYIALVKAETRRLASEGNDAEAIIAALTPRVSQDHPDWDQTEPFRIALAVQSFLASSAR